MSNNAQKQPKIPFETRFKLKMLRKKDKKLDELIGKTENFMKNGGLANEVIMDYANLAVHMLEKYNTDITPYTDKIIEQIVESAKKQQVLQGWK